MAEVRDRTFKNGEQVPTDGTTFVNCRFESAQLRYAGGALPMFEDCAFGQTGWYFADAALRTVQLIQALGNSNDGRTFVDALFAPGNFIGE